MVPNKEIVVGRSSDLDMVLVEEMVSRKHARIAYENDAVVIEDLGSTNGTFVNGEKIKRAQLKEGDRVLIGTSILKVTVMDGSSHEQGRPNLEVVAAQRRIHLDPGQRQVGVGLKMAANQRPGFLFGHVAIH